MKTISKFELSGVALALLAAAFFGPATASAQFYGAEFFGGGGVEQHSVLTINADGSSVLINTAIESRTTAEQTVRMMEHSEQESEDTSDADGVTPPKPAAATNEVKALTDEELVKKLTAQMDKIGEERNEADSSQKSSVTVDEDKVTITTRRTFPTLEDMLRLGYVIWGETGLQFENVRLETDTNGCLRLTLFPPTRMERSLKRYRSSWESSGMKTELKLVFPGRVLTSGFPVMATNATWLALDTKQDSSWNVLTNLYAGPVVIAAESGGLKLDQPLESRKLMLAARGRGPAADDLPTTEAGPGFIAEAQSVTTTTLHLFPGGEGYFAENQVATGAVVNVKFYAPKGRTLKAISQAWVITAVDNQGRSVVAESTDNAAETSETEEFSSGGAVAVTSMAIRLQLQLPQPDAQAIEHLAAEVVADTVGTWKETVLTNLQADATNEVDLAQVLPGAKITLEKLSAKRQQFTIRAKLAGPAAIQHLELQAIQPGSEQFNSSAFDRQSRIKGDQSSRTVEISGYNYGADSAAPSKPIELKIRYPEDLHRERVKFDLKGLDLF